MPVVINFKICDNVPECSGIEVCPTGAFYWDKDKKTIAIDEQKCTMCGLCQCCPVDAIKIARDENEHRQVEQDIADDPRKRADLFVDRYGAQPIKGPFYITESDFSQEIVNSPHLIMLEIFKQDSIECLLKSIPVKNIIKNFTGLEYRKMEAKTDSLIRKFKLTKTPGLLFFQSGKLLGKINGYYNLDQEKDLLVKIKKILK